jgi:hypothetical protein
LHDIRVTIARSNQQGLRVAVTWVDEALCEQRANLASTTTEHRVSQRCTGHESRRRPNSGEEGSRARGFLLEIRLALITSDLRSSPPG